ncbi:PREDICTED: uncharacterized protein LOC109237446 [Nicotiana attenuata]|uniref:uncharacterized protein LOC109237446 n=1 Tax=Nicotiana attenuata TaxID=49451 RepID=UPI0009048CB1|nr:PREDICTED: uncharacterized protein LOC109237446 [Nicotiana attenuata]
MAMIDSKINSTSTFCESTEFTLRPSIPLFVHSSDIPGLSLVPFSVSDFGGWRRSIIVSLSAKNKIEFIDGTFPRPPQNSPESGDIWTQLNRGYGTVNGTKVFEIKKELTSTHQGALDIASYFNKLKKLWDELRVMRSSQSNTCTCAA